MGIWIRSDSAYFNALKANGFTFWIYSTIGVNGTPQTAGNILAGASSKEIRYLNNGEGLILKANTWTQITIYPEDITGDGRFLLIQGSTAGTFYLDDFQALPAA